jgi:putative membrane protein
MDLRDELAIQRTILANQRTLLSFFTASLAIAVAGVTLIRFFEGHWAHWAGWALLPCAVILFIYGFKNYFSHKRTIETAYKSRIGSQ